MYKKALAFIMCVAAAAASVTSCGSRAQQSEGQSSSAVTSEKEKQTITYRLNITVFQDFLKGIADVFGMKGENYEK